MASGHTDEPSGGRLSYRERDVDATLDEHSSRISRLEKAALVGAGYALAEAPETVSQLAQFLI